MSRRKYRLPPPPSAIPSPAEIIELAPCSEITPGRLVTPLPGRPAPEIITLHPRGSGLDPNRPLVPTEGEVAALPRWARLAFAARCARRVLPLLPVEIPSDREYATHVVGLVAAAEQSAASGSLQTRALASALKQVKERQPESVGHEAVLAALQTYHWEGCKAAQTAVAVLQRLAVVRTLRFVLLPRRDFDCVQLAARQQEWTDDTPVPPEVFGPMWDREPPPWWREDVLVGLPSDKAETKPD